MIFTSKRLNFLFFQAPVFIKDGVIFSIKPSSSFSFNNFLPISVSSAFTIFVSSTFTILFLFLRLSSTNLSSSLRDTTSLGKFSLRNCSSIKPFFSRCLPLSVIETIISLPFCISIAAFDFKTPSDIEISSSLSPVFFLNSLMPAGFSSSSKNLFSGNPYFRYFPPFSSRETSSFCSSFSLMTLLFWSHCNALAASTSLSPVTFTMSWKELKLSRIFTTFLSTGFRLSASFLMSILLIFSLVAAKHCYKRGFFQLV